MYLLPFISKRFLGEPRISRNVDREDTKQSLLQAADKVSVLTLSSRYALNSVVSSKFTLYKADVPITGMLSDAYIIKRAVDDAADHEDNAEAR